LTIEKRRNLTTKGTNPHTGAGEHKVKPIPVREQYLEGRVSFEVEDSGAREHLFRGTKRNKRTLTIFDDLLGKSRLKSEEQASTTKRTKGTRRRDPQIAQMTMDEEGRDAEKGW
jgi:hypothetical protein